MAFVSARTCVEKELCCRWMLKPDGVFYFTTEMPGDESVVGWGAVRFLPAQAHAKFGMHTTIRAML